MVNGPSLAQLRDIHLPPPIGFWPLAAGWYVLALMVLFLIIVGCIYYRRHYQQGKAKRQALCLLKQYERHFQEHQNAREVCIQLSELLHRVALVYYPRVDVASLYGEKWIEFLNRHSKNLNFSEVSANLILVPYQKKEIDIDVALLFKLTRQWIQQRERPCLN